ncbi:MAG TPA: transcriptional regulator [bacterium]|nr:transcriptional regulator [bacterium]
MKEFLTTRAVFTVEELDSAAAKNKGTRNSLLQYFRKQGRIVPVRRGLYLVVPAGMAPDAALVDPYLIAAKAAPDAVIGYHSALEVHGRAYSTFSTVTFFSARLRGEFSFRGYSFRPVLPPAALRDAAEGQNGVVRRNRAGVDLAVTGLERTLVDVLDRPLLSGGWEEVWRSLEAVEFFDLDAVVAYTLLLNNGATAAKVGFFLTQHKEALMVEDRHLAPLLKLRPRQPQYWERAKRNGGKLNGEWNIIVPEEILRRSWEEVA